MIKKFFIVPKNDVSRIILNEQNQEFQITVADDWSEIEPEVKDKIARLTTGLRLSTPGTWLHKHRLSNPPHGYPKTHPSINTQKGTYEEFLDDIQHNENFQPLRYAIYSINIANTPKNITAINDTEEMSACEQVAELIGHELTTREKFIVAYEKQGFAAVKALALELGLTEDGVDEISEWVQKQSVMRRSQC